MALARVVTFEGINTDRIEEMKREMQDGDPPEGLNATEVVVLYDADADRAVAIVYLMASLTAIGSVGSVGLAPVLSRAGRGPPGAPTRGCYDG